MKVLICCLLILLCGPVVAAESPDFNRDVAPILRKYCAGCHNADDAEGKLALDSYAGVLRGGEHGAVVTPGHANVSRLLRVINGQAKPAMPPQGEAAPTDAEKAMLAAWITAGAKGPDGDSPDATLLVTPHIKPKTKPTASYADLAVSSSNLVAWATGASVALQPMGAKEPQHVLAGHRGPVNAVAFSSNGKFLAAAGGEPSLFGEVRWWSVATGKLERVIQGHRDSIYSVAVSDDGKLLATGGYDRAIRLWDLESGKEKHLLAGHNGPVFALGFLPGAKVLASASEDRTVKLWDVATGVRLDTFGQSPKELYAMAISPDGRRLAAGGVDGVLRIWSLKEPSKEGANPLLFSRFAHDGAILRIAYSPDGETIVTSAEDRSIKVWEARRAIQRTTLEPQTDWATALGMSADSRRLIVGRLDGTQAAYDLSQSPAASDVVLEQVAETPPLVDYGFQPAVKDLPRKAEAEPNDQVDAATEIFAPGVATGVLFKESENDVDLYRFTAKKGEQWIVETNAARSKSAADTKIEVLTSDGSPIERLRLRAVRETELEFRGATSEARGFRLLNYAELLLDRYVYLQGDIIKHFQQRRGPDSDAQAYPAEGKRRAYFDTSPRAHALGEVGYFVEPYPAGSKLPDNGLPVIPIFYENDDQSTQQLGRDSRLTFVAPADGEYVVRVTDARGFSGPKFTYELIVRRPQPGFSVKLTMDAKINRGSGKTIKFVATRSDNFAGPIQIQLSNLPEGFQATTPVEIQAGHNIAWGLLTAQAEAEEPTKEAWESVKVEAIADIAGEEVVKPVNNFGAPKVEAAPKVIVHLEPLEAAGDSPTSGVVSITPGTTTRCKLSIERKGFDGRVSFDPQNLPHGVIVDDIGLSGVLIPEGQTERVIFLTAEPWISPGERAFHLKAKVEGNQSSPSLILKVK